MLKGAGMGNAKGVRRFSMWTSIVLVLIGLVLAYFNQLPGIPPEGQLVPLISTLVGVTFYVLYNVRKRRDRFEAQYLPDYTFRAAQAVVYVYAILAMFSFLRDEGDQQALLRWPPNLVGLFVGMYILHVERAMEGLGYRFEEVLTAVLGRSLSLPTRREKDIELVQAEGRFRDIRQQAELLAAQAGPPALIQGFKERFGAVQGAISDRDHDAAVKGVGELSLDFEQTKQELRRDARTVRKVLGMVEASHLGAIGGPQPTEVVADGQPQGAEKDVDTGSGGSKGGASTSRKEK